MREIPPETVIRAKVYVDQRDACLAEAGDLLQPLRIGLITTRHVHAEIGEIVAGKKVGRVEEQGVTLFKSVGNAVQDLVVATEALRVAEQHNIGTMAEL